MSMSDIRAFFGGMPSGAAGKSKETGNRGRTAAVKGKSKTPDKNGKEEKSPKDSTRGKSSGKGRRKSKVTSVSDSDDEIKQVSKKKPKIQESDSEEEPLPSRMRKLSEEKKIKGRKDKKSRILDSDEEEVIPSSVKKAIEESEKKKQVKDKRSSSSNKGTAKSPAKNKSSPSKPVETDKKTKQKQEINAADFFGSAPVERTERKICAVKRKQPADEEKSSQQDKKRNKFAPNEENGVEHSKEKLNIVDDQELKQLPRKSPRKEGKSTLSSKLAKAAAAAESIPETPEKSPEKSPSPKKQEKTSPAQEHPGKKTKSEPSEKTNSNASPRKRRTPTKEGKTSSEKETARELRDYSTPAKAKTESQEEEIIPPSLEKKKSSYRSFMQRGGPPALGSKPIPEGEENCLEGLTFVITGVLESMERETAQDIIQRHGGRVTGSVSKKTSYIVVGDEAGETKLKRARELGTKRIDEDGLIELVKTLPGKKTSAESVSKTKQPKKSLKTPESSQEQEINCSQSQSQQLQTSTSTPSPAAQSPSPSPTVIAKGGDNSMLWVDKYKPRSCKQIIGQQGEKSNMNKLKKWLHDWHENRQKPKTKGGFFNKDPDGVSFKAALLSGPPGVGKTTTATLVCQELGFSYVEMNASDQRNKKTLEQSLATSTRSKTMDEYRKGQVADGKRHVLIMDEVDGMAGNEDRGGIQELIAMIKNSKIPIICMCNDRNHPKIRSLSNYCFDLRFQKPRVEQVKGAMMTIAFKEGLKVPPQAMEQVITGANQDLRQILYNLSMWTAKEKSMTYDQAKADASTAQKDIKLGPFDVIKKLLTGEGSKMSLVERSDLFFHDYSFVPLFVQENYLSIGPYKSGGDIKKTLELVSQTADSLCDGDLVEKRIRSSQSWNLLPMQAIYSCVIPSLTMMGKMSAKIDFPQWLGKNSRYGKFDRILQELQTHMRLSASANKMSVNLDYIPYLRGVLTRPLMAQDAADISEGVSRVIQIMDNYDLMKEDWESIMEVGQFDGHRDPVATIPSKVKAAFTRAYNKESHKTPYAIKAGVKKGRGRGGGESEGVLMEEGDERLEAEESDKEDEDEVENDAMVKSKKKPKPSTSGKGRGKGTDSGMEASEPATGKGKGKGKGKNRKN